MTKEGLSELSYEIAVIGSGPSGQRAAIQSAKAGKNVVVIDNRIQKLGGVSLHTGTIPSKTLREAVLYLKGLKRKFVYGSSRYSRSEVELLDLTEKVESILTYEIKVIERQFKRNGVDVIYGDASFADKNNIKISDKDGNTLSEINAEKIIIATGTNPRRPDDINFDQNVIFDSDFIFSRESKIVELPRSLIVYGAGVIGTEYAGMFAALGCKVSIIDSHADMFPFLDVEIVELIKKFFEELGVRIYLNEKYKKLEVTSEGKGKLQTESGNIYEADAILFSKGRTPATGALNIDKVGIETGPRGTINVNDKYQTSVKNIYACGDVIGFPALASTSSEQGRLAARFAVGLGVDSKVNDNFPYAIYSIPEMSSIGKTEQELIKEEIPYEKGVAYYYEIAKAAISGDDRGALKILFHKRTKKILGIHIIGEQAAEIIHIGQVVMSMGGTIDFFINNIFNYPTWAETYKVAALNGKNKLNLK
ncbi:MAG: Si-specific NAD(P)(+) transhydrogenase [Acidobacteriota bacterium]